MRVPHRSIEHVLGCASFPSDSLLLSELVVRWTPMIRVSWNSKAKPFCTVLHTALRFRVVSVICSYAPHMPLICCCAAMTLMCGWVGAGASVPERLNELYKLSELMVQKQQFTPHQHFLLTGNECERLVLYE